MPSILFLSALLAMTAADPGVPRRQPIEPEPDPDADPDPVIATRCDIGSGVMRYSRGADPLRRACRVCGAAPAAPCDPKRLGKAGRRGAVAHRSR